MCFFKRWDKFDNGVLVVCVSAAAGGCWAGSNRPLTGHGRPDTMPKRLLGWMPSAPCSPNGEISSHPPYLTRHGTSGTHPRSPHRTCGHVKTATTLTLNPGLYSTSSHVKEGTT